MKKEKITVVIPAYNEEKTIGECIERCKKYADEIIVALAKNSNDETYKIAKSKGARIIRDNGLGKGDGMRCAINAIDRGIIVFIDCDGSHIPEDIPKLVKPILQNKADMVIASRFLGGSEELQGDFDKSLRLFFSICIAKIINLRFKTKIMDTQNGFRAIKAEIAKKLNLKSNHTEIETEMNMKCSKLGYRIIEVPSKELKRKYGQSHVSLLKHGPRYFLTVLKNLI
ncbi:MAG: glycosyltransferase family 2 protein [Candidatus Pacearchaeota archaeon]